MSATDALTDLRMAEKRLKEAIKLIEAVGEPAAKRRLLESALAFVRLALGYTADAVDVS